MFFGRLNNLKEVMIILDEHVKDNIDMFMPASKL